MFMKHSKVEHLEWNMRFSRYNLQHFRFEMLAIPLLYKCTILHSVTRMWLNYSRLCFLLIINQKETQNKKVQSQCNCVLWTITVSSKWCYRRPGNFLPIITFYLDWLWLSAIVPSEELICVFFDWDWATTNGGFSRSIVQPSRSCRTACFRSHLQRDANSVQKSCIKEPPCC